MTLRSGVTAPMSARKGASILERRASRPSSVGGRVTLFPPNTNSEKRFSNDQGTNDE